MNTTDQRVFVFGAHYKGKDEQEFDLVRPSGQNKLPYVCIGREEAEKTYALVRHHSHLFEMHKEPFTDRVTVSLVCLGDASSLTTPPRVFPVQKNLAEDVNNALREQGKDLRLYQKSPFIYLQGLFLFPDICGVRRDR